MILKASRGHTHVCRTVLTRYHHYSGSRGLNDRTPTKQSVLSSTADGNRLSRHRTLYEKCADAGYKLRHIINVSVYNIIIILTDRVTMNSEKFNTTKELTLGGRLERN